MAIVKRIEAYDSLIVSNMPDGSPADKGARIMGSVDTYGEHLDDGSKYSGLYAKTSTKKEI